MSKKMKNLNEKDFYGASVVKEMFNTPGNPILAFPAGKWYVEKYKTAPDIHFIGAIKIDGLMEKYHDKMRWNMKYLMQTNDPTNLNLPSYLESFLDTHQMLTQAVLELEEGLVIVIADGSYKEITNEGIAQNVSVFYKKEVHDISELIEYLADQKVKTYTRSTLSLLTMAGGQFTVRTFDIPHPKIDFNINYNKDFREVHNEIVKGLSVKNGNGLVLLHGPPGTGKTTYIRYLITHLSKNKIYIPPNLVHELSNPSLIPFLMSIPNSILFVEDAENVLMQRQGQDNQSVSNILNITDGLLSDCLNIQIVCTFNTDLKNVDQALLRKGRLIGRYEFKELDIDRAEALAKKLKVFITDKEQLTLANIYNSDNKWKKEDD